MSVGADAACAVARARRRRGRRGRRALRAARRVGRLPSQVRGWRLRAGRGRAVRVRWCSVACVQPGGRVLPAGVVALGALGRGQRGGRGAAARSAGAVLLAAGGAASLPAGAGGRRALREC